MAKEKTNRLKKGKSIKKKGTPAKKGIVSKVEQASVGEGGGFGEMGTSGLSRNFGQIHEEFLIELRAERGIKIYKEMSNNDAVIGAVLFAIDMLIRGVEWHVEPEDDTNLDDIEAALFVEECMGDMSQTWEDFISEVLSMLPFGWSYFEKVFKMRSGDEGDPRSKFNDGRVGWRKMALRSQDTLGRWIFDDNGGIQGMRQKPPTGMVAAEVEIPIAKSLLFRTRIFKNNPEGRSVLRTAYRAWYYKKNIENIEGVGIERDLAGLPMAFVPPEVLAGKDSDARKTLATVKKIVTNVRRDEQEGIVFPMMYDANGNKMYDFQLLTTAGSRQFDTSKIISRYDQRIAMTVLADFILMGHEKVGSFALASSKTNLLAVACDGWMNSITGVINKHGKDQLLRINNMPGKCDLVHGDIETQGIEALGEFVEKLTRSGIIIPDNDLENALRSVGNLPPKSDDAGRDGEETQDRSPQGGKKPPVDEDLDNEDL